MDVRELPEVMIGKKKQHVAWAGEATKYIETYLEIFQQMQNGYKQVF